MFIVNSLKHFLRRLTCRAVQAPPPELTPDTPARISVSTDRRISASLDSLSTKHTRSSCSTTPPLSVFTDEIPPPDDTSLVLSNPMYDYLHGVHTLALDLYNLALSGPRAFWCIDTSTRLHDGLRIDDIIKLRLSSLQFGTLEAYGRVSLYTVGSDDDYVCWIVNILSPFRSSGNPYSPSCYMQHGFCPAFCMSNIVLIEDRRGTARINPIPPPSLDKAFVAAVAYADLVVSSRLSPSVLRGTAPWRSSDYPDIIPSVMPSSMQFSGVLVHNQDHAELYRILRSLKN